MYSMNLRDLILGVLNDGGKPVSVRELVQRLSLDKDARQDLKAVLRRLIDDGETPRAARRRI